MGGQQVKDCLEKTNMFWSMKLDGIYPRALEEHLVNRVVRHLSFGVWRRCLRTRERLNGFLSLRITKRTVWGPPVPQTLEKPWSVRCFNPFPNMGRKNSQHSFTSGRSCLMSAIAMCEKVNGPVDEGRALMQYTIILVSVLLVKAGSPLAEQHPLWKGTGFTEDAEPSMSQQCVIIIHMAGWNTSVTHRSVEVFPLYLVLVRPPLQYCVQLWAYPVQQRCSETGEGAGKRSRVSAWKVQIEHCTRKAVQHWNRGVAGCSSFDDFKAL